MSTCRAWTASRPRALIHEHPRFETHADHLRHRRACQRARSPAGLQARRGRLCAMSGGAGDPAQQGRGAGGAVSASAASCSGSTQPGAGERAARAQELDAAGGEDPRARTAEPHLRKANTELEQANQRAAERNRRARAAPRRRSKEADRNKDEFLAMLAHELRNPLAPIHNAVRDHAPAPHRRSAADLGARRRRAAAACI